MLRDKIKSAKTPHWFSLVEVWFDYYEAKFGFEPNFTGASAKSLKDIVKRLQQLNEQTQTPWSEDKAKATLTRFLSLAFEDKWLQQNFTLNVLYGKFDCIIARGKRPGGSAPKITANDLHNALLNMRTPGQ